MELRDIFNSLTREDEWAGRAGLIGKGFTLFGTTGFLTTQNLVWLAGVAFGAATLAAQIWWDWYGRRRRALIELEIYKARQRKVLEAEGFDTATIRALQQSPDSDA